MRKLFSLAVLLLSTLVLLGMGELGGKPSGTIPETEEDIRVHLTDRSGTQISLSKFSMDGQTSVVGILGSGELTVALKNIKRIDFGEASGEQVPVELHTLSGQTLQLKLRKRAIFYGDTGFGAFQIRARDVARIELR